MLTDENGISNQDTSIPEVIFPTTILLAQVDAQGMNRDRIDSSKGRIQGFTLKLWSKNRTI
jgi:hypothetical protein